MPPNFSWVDAPRLAAHGYPESAEDIVWLRKQGIEILISLTEDAAPRQWVNDAGLMHVHIPIPDMTAPTDRQFDLILDTFNRAHQANLGVAVHCAAGRGRTGVVLAAYFVHQGQSARDTITKVRNLRPGSIETYDQEEAVVDLARRIRNAK
ncbi:dual specificity protein phosphatase 23 [soil metagenome]